MGKLKPKERGVEEKMAIVLSLLKGESSAAELCRRYSTTENSLNKWRQRFLEGGKAALNGRKAEAQGALEQETASSRKPWPKQCSSWRSQKNSGDCKGPVL